MRRHGYLYYHSPCFDGIVSAVVAWDFLETKNGWTTPTLHSVNYDLRESWLSTTLETPCAIVDFLYHPQAEFWADHHSTTFLTEYAKKNFEERRNPALIYDNSARSCAGLLWRHLAQAFGYSNSRYTEMVQWAEKIDSASYESVNEVILSSAPALIINMGLALGDHDKYCERLVHAFRNGTLDQIADLPEVQVRFERAQSMIQSGLDRFKKVIRLESDGIVVFDIDGRDTIISRYAPYYFFPEARYSAGIVRWEGGAKITVMRNPWREFESVPLGEICEELGGGGHRRVGSIVLRGERVTEAPSIFNRLLSEIRRRETGGNQTA